MGCGDGGESLSGTLIIKESEHDQLVRLQEKVKIFTEWLCNEIDITLPTMKKNPQLNFSSIVDYQVEAASILENFEAIFQINCENKTTEKRKDVE